MANPLVVAALLNTGANLLAPKSKPQFQIPQFGQRRGMVPTFEAQPTQQGPEWGSLVMEVLAQRRPKKKMKKVLT